MHLHSSMELLSNQQQETAWSCPLFRTVAHNFHGKIFLLTAKSISSRQNQFRHGKINFITAKSISPQQNQFHHGKINFTIRQNQFHHGKISFITAKSFSSTAKSFSSTAKYISPRQNNFGLTCSRDISSQSAMGVNPSWRSSSWYHDSTCIASTVEIVCFEQHISACSMDKVSRNWLMDVFKYTQCILLFLFCDRLTFMEF